MSYGNIANNMYGDESCLWVEVRAVADWSPLQGSESYLPVTQGFTLGCDGVAPSGLIPAAGLSIFAPFCFDVVAH